jgi:hypothetical protein
MPVTCTQCGTHRLLGVRRRDLEDSEPNGGDRITVVQHDYVFFEGAAHDEESARRAGLAPWDETRTDAVGQSH